MARVAFVLDTDIGSDVDDALAVAFALRHPDLDLRAVTTVSGDTVRRARIAAKLLRLAGRDDIPVAAGERGEQTQPERPAEGGHEDEMLGPGGDSIEVRDDGVGLLLATTAGGDVEIATVGMQSNLAAAVDRDPSLPGRLPRLTVMGGVFAPGYGLGVAYPPTADHNLCVDQPASVRALNAGFKTLFVPCDVTMGTWLKRSHLDRLRRGDALCREVARQIDVYGRSEQALPEGRVCQLHDPLAVACMVDRRFVTTMRAPVTVAIVGNHVRTFIDPLEGREAEIVTSVEAEALADWWLETVLG